MIIIKEGRIVFQIGYTEDIKLEIKTSNRYMTGNWTHVEATRYYDRKKKIEKGIKYLYYLEFNLKVVVL